MTSIARDAQIVDGALSDGALAERRQHVGDVVEECSVRTDHEDAVARQPSAVLEQEKRCSVERHGRLAGARAALDDQDLVDVGSDHDVLLALDRRDDLAHLAGPFCADLGQNGVGDPRRRTAGIGIVEVFVEVRHDLAVVERETTPELQAQRVDARRPVERRRDRRPPVDDDRIVPIVLDVATPHVPAAVLVVDPPEEVAGPGTPQVIECFGDGDLDVVLRDLVGGTVGVDGLQPGDHPVSGRARVHQLRSLGGEVGKEVGVHGT